MIPFYKTIIYHFLQNETNSTKIWSALYESFGSNLVNRLHVCQPRCLYGPHWLLLLQNWFQMGSCKVGHSINIHTNIFYFNNGSAIFLHWQQTWSFFNVTDWGALISQMYREGSVIKEWSAQTSENTETLFLCFPLGCLSLIWHYLKAFGSHLTSVVWMANSNDF